MKVLAGVLFVIFLGLQYRLWISDDGVRAVVNLRQGVEAQQAENATLRQRNQQLAAEVKDLKEGLSALEERARNDLGMVGVGETFFQVVDAQVLAAQGAEAPPRGATPGVPAPDGAVRPPEELPVQRTAR